MTFARKGTRRIVVRNETYHWKDGAGITIERPGGGGRLHATMPSMQYAEPKNVADLIAYALDHGWEPNRPGKTFEISDGTSLLPEYSLWQAVCAGETATVSAMLAAGKSPEGRFHGQSLINTAISFHKLEILTLLMDAGADPDGDGRDSPPLVLAVLHDSLESIATLLAHGANVHIRDRYGRTALSLGAVKEQSSRTLSLDDPYTIRLRQRAVEIVALLRRAGATE